jgi:glycosyltransferase involved in cell wall biosynthesis
MQPLVSILIPAYNAEQWIADALHSALAQTWSRKEIIVVNDGSPDNTLAVARKFESPITKVVSQPNQGASAARNHAQSLAQGDFIQWLDADDVLAPDKIARQLQRIDFASSTRTVLSSAWGQFYYRLRKARISPSCLWRDQKPIEWLVGKMQNNLWMAIESWLIPRQLAEIAGPWNTELSTDDDGEYFSRVISRSEGVVFVPDARSFCRSLNFGSLSKNVYTDRKAESQFRSMSSQIGYARELEDSDRVRAAGLAYLQTWFIYFYPEKPQIVERARALAAELGGALAPPKLRWKYAALQKVFGWNFAKRARQAVPQTKECFFRGWDRLLASFEAPGNSLSFGVL